MDLKFMKFEIIFDYIIHLSNNEKICAEHLVLNINTADMFT